jgi:hypothetical protein
MVSIHYIYILTRRVSLKFGLMFERDATNSRDTRNIRNSHSNIDASNSPGANNSSNRATTLAITVRHQQQGCKHKQGHKQQQGLERASINNTAGSTAALETTATEEGHQQQGFHQASAGK